MKVSIVIPTYNEEGYIGQLLESISRQTIQPHEVIVVDNYSTDKTCKIIARYTDRLPLICLGLARNTQRGIGASRNAGASLASGDTLLFLDADVELLPDFLKDAGSEFADRHLDVASAHFYIDPASAKMDLAFAKAISLYHASFQYSKNPMGSGFCIFARREWHKRIQGFNECFRHSEDHDYVKRAVEHGAIFRLLKSVRFKLSYRRYVHDGRFNVLSLYTKAEINRLFFNYKYAPREEALYHFGTFGKKNKRRSAQTS